MSDGGDARGGIRRGSKMALGVMGVLAVLIVAAAVGAGLWIASVPDAPAAPELEGVQLETLAPAEPSSALAEVPGLPDAFDQDAYVEVDDALRAGTWLPDPARIEARVEGIAPVGRAIVRAMREPGCLDGDRAPTLPMLASMRGYVAWLVAQLQRGSSVPAVEELTTALQAVTTLRARCAHPILETSMLQIMTDALHAAAGHALVAVDGADGAARRRALVDALLAVEALPDELPRALRREWARSEAVTQQTGLEAAQARILARAHRRLLHLAESPSIDTDLGAETPEERYVSSLLADYPETIIGLRLGPSAVSWQITSATIGALRPRLVTYRQGRCELAHRRARWLRGLAARGQPVEGAPTAAPTSPWTGQALDLDLPEGDACSPPRSETDSNREADRRGRHVSAREAPDLPPPPRAAN